MSVSDSDSGINGVYNTGYISGRSLFLNTIFKIFFNLLSFIQSIVSYIGIATVG